MVGVEKAGGLVWWSFSIFGLIVVGRRLIRRRGTSGYVMSIR
jgi:hypothetical protein